MIAGLGRTATVYARMVEPYIREGLNLFHGPQVILAHSEKDPLLVRHTVRQAQGLNREQFPAKSACLPVSRYKQVQLSFPGHQSLALRHSWGHLPFLTGSTPFVGALTLLASAALQSFHIRQVLSSPGRNFVRQEVFFRQKENIRAT